MMDLVFYAMYIRFSIPVTKFTSHCRDSSIALSGRETLDNASATGILVPSL